MPHTAPLEPDDPQRIGVYRLLGRIGAGGQGVVYLGEHADHPGDEVAIKLLHSDWLRDPTALGRLAKEVAAARRVASFCTARVLDADLDARPPYVVSEYIEGPALLTHVSQSGPLSGSRLIRLAVGTATALTAIHQHGVVHRDFKPGNIILGPDGPRVIDFGIAREQAVDATGGVTGVVGTPVYMAPEHFTGAPIGPAADVFAWASTMVYAATGRGPFTASSLAAIMNRVINDEPTTGDLPEPLAGLIHRCLAKDPAARPTSRDVLLGLLADTEETVPTDSPVYAAASHAAEAPPVPFGPPHPGAPGAPPTGPAAVPPPAYGASGPQAPIPPGGHYGDVPYGAENPPGPTPAGPPPGPQAGMAGPPPGGGLGGPGGPGDDGRGKRRKVLAGVAAGAGAVVILAGVAFLVFGRGPSPARAVNETPNAQPGPRTTGPQTGKDDVAGNGRSKAEQAQKKKAKDKAGKNGRKHSGKRPSERRTSGPGKTPRDEPSSNQPPPPPKANKYTATQACGSGYRVLVSRALYLKGARVATTYLLYNDGNAYNCAVTLRSDQRTGTTSGRTTAFLQVKGSSGHSDSGAYKWYAGPVRAHAPKTCVRYGGSFTMGSTTSWISPYGHCD